MPDSSMPSPASQTKAFAGWSPDSWCGLHRAPDDLRPATLATSRTDHARAPHQYLRPHPGGNPDSGVLHQGPRPCPATVCAADVPPASPEPRRALATIDRAVSEHITDARCRSPQRWPGCSSPWTGRRATRLSLVGTRPREVSEVVAQRLGGWVLPKGRLEGEQVKERRRQHV